MCSIVKWKLLYYTAGRLVKFLKLRILKLYILAAMCLRFVWVSEQTANFALHSIQQLVFITETASVYCAVRTGSSKGTVYVPFLEG